ncbi:MAG: glycosyltransferase family 39 protein [Caldilineales bacterium]|nr:glycosyltransferase family 39 protein [Caldilineales bacterium]
MRRVGIFTILLLAAALRWYELGLVEYKYDEAHITGLAQAVARGEALPILSGGTSPGIPRAALVVYLQAVALRLLAPRPEAAVWLTAALGVVAAALTYRLGRRLGGEMTGTVAALYMAANPWLVAYDRKLWAHIQVVLSVALLLLAWDLVVRARPRAAFWLPVLAALQMLSHVLALVQALSWPVAALLARREGWRRPGLGGMAVALALLAPYGWALARVLVGNRRLPAWSARTEGGWPPAWESAFRLFGGDGIAALAGLPTTADRRWQLAAALAVPVLALIGLGMLRAALWLRHPRQRRRAALLLGWTVGPTLVLLAAPWPVAQQYWTVLLPLPALYFALGWTAILVPVGRWRGRITAAALTGLAAVWVGSWLAVLAAVATGAGGMAFGAPLARWQDTLAVVREWTTRLGIEQVRVAARGVDPALEGDPAVVTSLIGNPPFARFVASSSPPALLLSADRESLYLWTLGDAAGEAQIAALGEPVWEGFLAYDLPRPRLYRLPAFRPDDFGITLLPTPAVFPDAGMALIGYRLSVDGETVEAVLVWRVTAPPPTVGTRDLTAFNHIVDVASGERVAQADGLALLSRDWWPGDVLVQPYRVALPAGAYLWRVGLYSRVDGGRILLPDGRDALDLGPFRVGD